MEVASSRPDLTPQEIAVRFGRSATSIKRVIQNPELYFMGYKERTEKGYGC